MCCPALTGTVTLGVRLAPLCGATPETSTWVSSSPSSRMREVKDWSSVPTLWSRMGPKIISTPFVGALMETESVCVCDSLTVSGEKGVASSLALTRGYLSGVLAVERTRRKALRRAGRSVDRERSLPPGHVQLKRLRARLGVEVGDLQRRSAVATLSTSRVADAARLPRPRVKLPP